MSDRGINLFISFASADAGLQQALAKHLAILCQVGDVRRWSAEDIPPGADRHQEFTKALEHADVALLLLSADFLASETLVDFELPELLRQHERRGLHVIPVLLRTCAFQYHPWLGKLTPLPQSGIAIAAYAEDDRDRAFTEVAQEIAGVAGIRCDERAGVPAIPLHHRPDAIVARRTARRRSDWWFAAFVGAISIAGLLIVTQGNNLIALIAAETGTCVPGRQKRYNGQCVANRVADFLTCLKESNAIAALNVSEEALRSTVGQQDDAAVAAILSRAISTLRPEDRALMASFCLEAARDAGVILEQSPDSTRSSSSEPAPHASAAVSDSEDAGSAEDGGGDAESGDSGAGSSNVGRRDLLGCGGPLNDLGLCSDVKKQTCREIGSACSSTFECCGYNVSCQQKVCSECASVVGSSCDRQRQCCNNLNLRCSEGACVQCVSRGSACDSKLPCCDGLRCDGSQCSSAPSTSSSKSTAAGAPTCNCRKGDPLCSCL